MLDDKSLEYYVIRNERIADLAIYSFEDGERFEPDFLLFIKKNKESGYHVDQVYVDPNGSHLLEKDRWKSDFLISIGDHAVVDKKYFFNNDYNLMGLPLFNEEHELLRFKESVEIMVNKL